MESLLLNNQ